QRHVHDLANLLCVTFGERTAEDGEVLAEDEDQPPANRTRTGHHTIARDALRLHAEIGAIMLDEHVEFFEASLVEQYVEPLARGKLALGMLRFDAFLAAAHAGRFAPTLQLGNTR